MSKKTGLKNRVPLSNAVDKELYAKLKAYSLQTDIPVSKLLDRAIRLLLDSLENSPT